MTGGVSKGGLDSIEELASRSTESMSDEDHTVVLPQLVAGPPDLLVPPKNGSSNVQKLTCQLESYHLEPDTISEPQILDVRKASYVFLVACIRTCTFMCCIIVQCSCCCGSSAPV